MVRGGTTRNRSRTPAGVENEVQSVMTKFDRLNPLEQCRAIPLMIGMPEKFLSAHLSFFDLREAIIRWARGEGGCGLPKLSEALDFLIAEQRVHVTTAPDVRSNTAQETLAHTQTTGGSDRHSGILRRRSWTWWSTLALLVIVIVFFLLRLGKPRRDLNSSEIEVPPFDVMNGAELARGFDMGVNSALGMTDWVIRDGEEIKVAYPGSQAWGAVFVTVGPLKPAPHPSRDFSAYRSLSIDIRGQFGGETVDIGIKGARAPDDGSEMKIPVRLAQAWTTYAFQLGRFGSVDLKNLYVVAEFVFTGREAETVYFRNIRYFTEDKSQNTESAPSKDGTNKPLPVGSQPTKGASTGSTNLHDYPVWERVERDLQKSHANDNAFKARPLGTVEFAAEPRNAADKSSSAWQRQYIGTKGAYCRQIVEVTEMDSAGVQTCHIEAALYQRERDSWRFVQVVFGKEGCSN